MESVGGGGHECAPPAEQSLKKKKKKRHHPLVQSMKPCVGQRLAVLKQHLRLCKIMA